MTTRLLPFLMLLLAFGSVKFLAESRAKRLGKRIPLFALTGEENVAILAPFMEQR